MVILASRNIPNLITILRLMLIIPIVVTLLEEQYAWAFALFLMAGISDGIDGFLARRYQWTSKFGAAIDPFADKLLMVATFFCLAWLGRIPWWVFIIVVGRDLWIMAGALAYRFWVADYAFKPTRISKLNTFLQILLVISVLFEATFLKLSVVFTETLLYLVLITTISSMIDYTWVWGRRALEQSRLKSL